MSNVVILNCVTTHDLDPDRILESAKGKLKACFIFGYEEDDSEYFASSIADGGTLLWLMERAKMAMMKIATEEEPKP